MKSLFLALIFCLFIVSNNAAIYTWVGGATGNFNNATNWGGTVPTNGDTAILIGSITVTVSQTNTITQLTLAANVKVIVQGNSQFIITTNVTQAGIVTIQTEAGSNFNCQGYFTFDGTSTNFINFGTASLNPMVIAPVLNGALSNIPQGNPVTFSGSLPNYINAAFYIPNGFQFAQNAQTFTSLVAGGLITFAYTETIPTGGWQLNNNGLTPCSISFLNGANINGPITTNGGTIKPSVTFAGTFTVASNVNLDVTPVIGTGANVVSFNGANIGFNLNQVPLLINTANLQGTSTLTFTNGNTIPVTASFTVATTVSLNVAFVGNWIFDVSNVVFANTFNLNFNLTLAGSAVSFLQPATFSNGVLLSSTGGKAITFTNSINSLNGVTFTGFVPIFDCTLGNNKQFSITGTSSLSFPFGVSINGCTVTSAASLNIQGSVTTNNGNTTLPTQTSFTGTIVFSSTGGFNSITLLGTQAVPTGQAYSANGVEVIMPSSGVFTLNDNSQITNAANGLFTLNGGIGIGSGCTVSSLTAFPSGNSVINGAFRVTWGGDIILRNTILGGNGDIWFTGNLFAVKGTSTITNPTFRFKSAIQLTYQWDGFLPNSGCQLVINSGASASNRTVEGSVTANQNAGIVFDDNINFNVTSVVTGVPNVTPPGTVTFRTSGQTLANITTPQSVTFNGNVYFNHTNFHLMGTGNYFVGANASIFLQGGLNSPAVNGDSIFNITAPVFIGAIANSTLGTTVIVSAGLTTDDLDGNPKTATTTLTLSSTTTQFRNIQGPYVLGSSLTFGGNVNLFDPTTINSPGTISILGNTLSLFASATWQNNIVISGAFTINSLAGATLTIGEQNPAHGFNIPAAFTVLSPASVIFDSVYTVNFQSASTLGGNAQITFKNAFIGGNAAVTISPQTLILSNTTFIGTGSFTVSPVDQNLNVATLFRSFVPLTYSGNQLTVTANTAMSNTITFSANPITINGAILTVSTGSYSIGTRWVVSNGGIVFLGAVTLQSTGSFGGVGGLTFNNSLILTQSTTISNPVTFGQGSNYLVTVSNSGFTLTLTSTSVTVVASVVSNGGSIVSTSPSPAIQSIAGGGVISSDWTWTNTVQFGALNVTGARTLTFNLLLTSGATTYFTDGVTFNGGTFAPLNTGDTPTLDVEKSITTSVTTLLAPQITLAITGNNGFIFQGSSVLSVNGTVNCFTTVTFSQNVIFGWVSPTTANPITLKTGTSAWLASNTGIQLQLWRTNINLDQNVTTAVYPSIIFGLPTITVTTSNFASITFYGNLNTLGTAISAAGTGISNFGAITYTPVQNSTVSGFVLLGTLTFNSTTTPFVETVFVPPAAGLTQTLVLNGPVRMGSPTFGPQAQILGPARVAITDALTVSSAFQFGAPVQLYVSQPLGTFTITLSGTSAYLTFGTTPSLFNPLGYNLLSAPNFVLNSGSRFNILKFSLTTAFTIGNLAVNNGIAQFSQSTTTAQLVNVAGGATLWVDATNFNANQVIFSQNPDGTNPSYYQLTVSSQTPPAITTGAVVYKGVASIVVVNFNWNGQAITGITASSANGASANFVATVGSPGYQYQSVRSGNNVQFTRTVNPSVSPFPTQSNGPSPGVSSSSILSFNVALFALILIFFIFN